MQLAHKAHSGQIIDAEHGCGALGQRKERAGSIAPHASLKAAFDEEFGPDRKAGFRQRTAQTVGACPAHRRILRAICVTDQGVPHLDEVTASRITSVLIVDKDVRDLEIAALFSQRHDWRRAGIELFHQRKIIGRDVVTREDDHAINLRRAQIRQDQILRTARAGVGDRDGIVRGLGPTLDTAEELGIVNRADIVRDDKDGIGPLKLKVSRRFTLHIVQEVHSFLNLLTGLFSDRVWGIERAADRCSGDTRVPRNVTYRWPFHYSAPPKANHIHNLIAILRPVTTLGMPCVRRNHAQSDREMIRAVFCVLIAAGLAAPAFAADWSRYVNAISGVGVDIPANYAIGGTSPMGEGKVYRHNNGRSTIAIWGAPVSNDFSADVQREIGRDEADGWGLTYRSVTPDWAAWGGTRAGHVFYTKTILTCDGRQTANVRLQYPAADIPNFDAIAMRLGQSLAQDGGCF